VNCSKVPVEVSGISNATQVAVGGLYTCALLTGGSVDCWGDNEFGELGDGTTGESYVPMAVSGITNATQIATGSDHACALLTGGSVDCWGLNEVGELGEGTSTGPETCISQDLWGHPCSTRPVAVSGITNATQIATGGFHTCALLTGGSVDCWGRNNFGELGDGTTENSDVPVAVSGITNATQIATGGDHTCALLTGGGVDCWGWNEYGQLGDATSWGPEGCLYQGSEERPCSTAPVPVSGITNATQIATGGDHTCALLTGGSVNCWGLNGYGELGNGDGNGTNSGVPVAVSGITNATSVAGGGVDTCALLNGGSVDCWGGNEFGELGNGTTTQSYIPVVVSRLP
jgi:alpha-tubulin suppressor-like RCC1 family protein